MSFSLTHDSSDQRVIILCHIIFFNTTNIYYNPVISHTDTDQCLYLNMAEHKGVNMMHSNEEEERVSLCSARSRTKWSST